MSQRFGPVRQVGYVVRDIEAAMRHWVALGVGPALPPEEPAPAWKRFLQ